MQDDGLAKRPRTTLRVVGRDKRPPFPVTWKANPMNPETTHQAIDRAAAAADLAGEQALGAAHRGVSALRDTSQQLADRAHRASESTVTYIRDEPVKALLIAAAAGATLMALMNLATRSRH